MEPDLQKGNEFVYIPSYIAFHDVIDSTPGVRTFTIYIHLFTHYFFANKPDFISSIATLFFLQKIQIWHYSDTAPGVWSSCIREGLSPFYHTIYFFLLRMFMSGHIRCPQSVILGEVHVHVSFPLILIYLCPLSLFLFLPPSFPPSLSFPPSSLSPSLPLSSFPFFLLSLPLPLPPLSPLL